MDVSELEAILKISSTGGTNRHNIVLDPVSDNLLDKLSANRSNAIRTSIYNLYYNRFGIVKVVNKVNDRELYLIDNLLNFYTPGYILHNIKGDSRIAIDMDIHGISVFDIEIKGIFKSMIEALDYRDYMINKSLNNGIVVYNTETYTGVATRVLHIPLSNDLILKFFKLCSIKKKSVNQMIRSFIVKLVTKYSDLIR